MNKRYLLLTITFSLLVLFLGLGIVYLSRDKSGTREYTPPTLERGDEGYEEVVTTVEVGTTQVPYVTYDKVEGDRIHFREGDSGSSLKMESDGVVIACTEQSLDQVTELDFEQIKKIKEIDLENVYGFIYKFQQVVLFANEKQGQMVVHSIVLNEEECSI